MPITPSVPAAAGVVFAPAIAAVYAQDRRAAKNGPATPLDLLGAGVIAADRLAAPAADRPAAIDTGDARWPTAMIARIETLRDAIDAVDTRIRLLPDALGSIDVALRRDGDNLHVHFTAEQPQTRALLHEAAPRLAEAAEQRGVRLGQTSVDSGTGSGTGGSGPAAQGSGQGGFTPGGQGQPRQSAPEPRRPASAFTRGEPRASVDPVDDTRIA